MDPKRLGLTITIIVVMAVLMYSSTSLFESLNADETMVVQSVQGNLVVHTDPGVHWQGFGRVTKYKKRDQYSFSGKDETDASIGVTFNDGGHAKISGVISWEMPAAPDKVLHIHSLFGGQDGVEQQLIRPSIERAVYLTGLHGTEELPIELLDGSRSNG